jgi:hypothetical protein
VYTVVKRLLPAGIGLPIVEVKFNLMEGNIMAILENLEQELQETRSRYYFGEKMLIGYRNDNTLFWLKTDKNNWEPDIREKYWEPGNEYRDDRTLYWLNNENYMEPDKGEFNVLEAGKAWIDEKTDTTILDFPTSDEDEIHNLKKEFYQSSGLITQYKETDYYVLLGDCLPNRPIKIDCQLTDAITDFIVPDYELPENMEGYVLNEDTFLRKNNETGKLCYIKFNEFTKNDFDNDRFGWIKAAREYYSSEYYTAPSDEEIMSNLKCFKKESYGDAWIDEKNDVLVLGPIKDQRIDILDNNFYDRMCSYLGIYSEWNRTQGWIDIESGLNKNPYNFKVNYFRVLEKYMC